MIDDDETMSSLFKILLESEGCICTTETNASKALVRIRTEGMPSLIFLDCNMPRHSGEDFLNGFETLPNRCPVVGFSSFAKGSPIVAKFEARVDRYIEKPDNIDTFLDVVRQFVPLT